MCFARSAIPIRFVRLRSRRLADDSWLKKTIVVVSAVSAESSVAVASAVSADPSTTQVVAGDIGSWLSGGKRETVTFPNSRAIHFDNLQRGKDTWFRVRARNVVGAGPWSDPATIMVT